MGQHRTKRDAINAALEEYVRKRKQLEILGAFGTIEYDDDYDYKRERNGRTEAPQLTEDGEERSQE